LVSGWRRRVAASSAADPVSVFAWSLKDLSTKPVTPHLTTPTHGGLSDFRVANDRQYIALPTGMFISKTMALDARICLLFVPLVTALDPAAAHASQSGDFARLVDVGGGRKIYLECRGEGSPTVVLVAGLRGSAEDWNIAAKPGPRVFPEVAKFTRVCAYDRAGTPVGEKPSRSDPVHQPTTAGTAVADLHALLTAAGEAGHYVLVAHSYGGLAGFMPAPTRTRYPVFDPFASMPAAPPMEHGLTVKVAVDQAPANRVDLGPGVLPL
jgi:Alpha/beta hydrolase family